MGLDRRLAVVLFQRGEVLDGEGPALGVQMHRDCRAEHRQAPAQGGDLLFVQPEERAVHQAGHVLDLRPQQRVTIQRIQHRAKGGFHLNILAASAFGDLTRKMGQECLRALSP